MKSRTSPQRSDRACLCKNGTYDVKCCKGKFHQQGIGQTKNKKTSNFTINGN